MRNYEIICVIRAHEPYAPTPGGHVNWVVIWNADDPTTADVFCENVSVMVL